MTTTSLTAASASVAPARQRARVAGLRWPPTWALLGGVAVLLVAAGVSAATVDTDGGTDLLGLARTVGSNATNLRWQFTSLVILLALGHYGAAAIAARAASGLALPLGEVTLVQFAAAAANRLTPAGLGASAVSARYFSRRGLDLPGAVGAVTALSLLGSVADVLVLGAVLLVGRWLGLAGSVHQLGVVTTQVAAELARLRSVWLWVVGVAVVAAALVLIRVAVRAGHGGRLARAWTPVRALARRPRALLTLVAASGSTTLILAFAFSASVAMVPGPHPHAGLGALVVAFMVASAAGNSVPIPAGLGSTEAALVAALVSMHEPSAAAVQQVLIFRLLTFWLPAIIGVLCTRRLRARRAL